MNLPMPVRRWLHRRGLLYSPSTAMLYDQGTLLRPGRNLWADFRLSVPAGTVHEHDDERVRQERG